jgi:hypothetical protein
MRGARRVPRTLASIAVVVGVVATFATGPASAITGTVSCHWDAATHVITVTTTAGEFANIERNGATIEVNGSLCFGSGLSFATLAGTKRIIVNGGAGNDHVTIMLREGRFAPGYDDERGGSDEIEFRLNLGSGDNDLGIWGTAFDDRVRIGTGGSDVLVNLNAGESTGLDADIRATGLSLVYVMGWDGDDVISAVGGRATGSMLSIRFDGEGGEGDDQLTGGSGDDEIEDVLIGGDHDVLRGRGGADYLRVSDADGTDVVWPGNGIDVCAFDPADTVNSCEGTEL